MKPSSEPLTHAELVAFGARWLAQIRRYPVVVTELGTSAREVPDILGWKGGACTQIEVKVSVADFRADRAKRSRQHPELEVGRQRYYLVPLAIAKQAEDKLLPGWGLLYQDKYGTMQVQRKSEIFEASDRDQEAALLLSLIRRIAGKSRPLPGVQVRPFVDYSELEIDWKLRQLAAEGLTGDREKIRQQLAPRASALISALPADGFQDGEPDAVPALTFGQQAAEQEAI